MAEPNWTEYILRYPDLQKAGINSKAKAMQHWNNYGKKEGRKMTFIEKDYYVYYSPGLLGDFIHQLSVIKEIYEKTGKKGLLYIVDSKNRNLKFRFSIEKTYVDTYQIIIAQPYIKDYQIYNGQKYDYNLSSWRYCGLIYNANLYAMFLRAFNIEWGKHQWLHYDKIDEYSDYIFINTSTRRFPTNIKFNRLFEPYNTENIVFISQDQDSYNFFTRMTGIKLQFHKVADLHEFVVLINSCKLFIGNLSAPLAIAYALHKDSITLLNKSCVDNIHSLGLEDIVHTQVLV